MSEQNLSAPKISIVTICYNAEAHIAQTIQSVLEQTYPHIEYIIIDGASTDSTLKIIEPYKKSLAHFISEPDKGISNAMNKGIAASSGDYILFLHADDFLTSPSSIATAVNEMANTQYLADIYAFAIHYGQFDNYQLLPPTGLNYWTNVKLQSGINHQGSLSSRKLFQRLGGFDESLKICMDYDWFLRAYRIKARIELANFPLTLMRDTGISSKKDWEHTRTRILEEKQIHEKNQTHIFQRVFYKLWWFCYPIYKNDSTNNT